MKKIKVLAFVAFLLSLGACSKDEVSTVDFFEPLAEDTLWFGPASATQYLELKANSDIAVTMPEEADPWCDALLTGTGEQRGITVHCTDNTAVGERYTTISLKSGAIEQKLVVCQYGIAPVIKVTEAVYKLSQDSVVLHVPVISTVEYEVVTEAAWIHLLGVIKGMNADTVKLGISASIYPHRMGEVLLKWEQLSAGITVSQTSSDTVYQAGDAGSLIRLAAVSGGSANFELPGQPFAHTYDGRTSSFVGGWMQPEDVLEMVWNFEQPEKLERMCYVPQSDEEPQRALGKFELLVREEGSSGFRSLGTFDFQYRRTVSELAFDKDMKKVESVKMLVAAPEGTTRQWVFICQEMEFRESLFDVSSIFTDALCTDLKKEVTLEQIMSVEEEFYRNLARSLYLGTYDKEFRVQEYRPYVHPDIQKADHRSFAWSFLDNPTGIYVKEGEDVPLFVENTHGEVVKVVVMDWKKSEAGDVKPTITAHVLKDGLNVIKNWKDGLMYIHYLVDDCIGKQPVKIHIPGGRVNGYFDIVQHDNQFWKSLLNKADFEFLDVKGELSHLVFPTADYRSYCPDNVERLVEVYDSIVLLEHQLSGLYKHDRMYNNRMLYRVTYEEGDFLMYATNYHTACIHTATPSVLNAEKVRKEVWGVAHEMGHVHQTQGITWRGMTEVSNNVFSLFVQTTFGSTSRLIEENRYQEAYDQIVIPKAPHALTIKDGKSVDNPFAKVVPLWQLQLYFAKVLDKPEFYMDMYEELREEPALQNPQLNFVEVCCRNSQGIDLIDFFRFYGFFLPLDDYVFDSVNAGHWTVRQSDIDATLSRLAGMSFKRKAPAIQYLNDENVEMFRNMKAIEKGQITLNGSSVSISGWKNVVAYEVYDGDYLIQISLKDSFTLKNTGSNVKIQAVAADGTKVEVE